ncbi:MAG: ceramidase domain-containing protein [Patescibacteria group bacterium]
MIRNLLSQPTVTFCEEITNNIISRPNYAISNLAYISVGLFLFIKVKQNKIYLPFAVLALTVGTASMLYDVKPLYLTQLLDLLAMLVIASLMIFLNFSNLYKLSIKKCILIATAMITLGMFFVLIFQGHAGNFVFGFFIAVAIVSEYLVYQRKLHKEYKYWIAALIIFLIGFAVWLPDGTKTYCNPIALLNGRAVFHYLTAISIYLLAVFYSKSQS